MLPSDQLSTRSIARPGVGAADVEHVRRGAREADELALVEDRDHDRDVRRVRGAARRGRCGGSRRPSWMSSPRILITFLTIFGIAPMNIGVESDSARLLPVAVEDAGAEVLGLADDRGVRHAVEHAGHLLRDRGERAADHAHQDRRREPGAAAGLGACGASCSRSRCCRDGRSPPRGPAGSPSSCRTARRSPGPTSRSPARSSSRS